MTVVFGCVYVFSISEGRRLCWLLSKPKLFSLLQQDSVLSNCSLPAFTPHFQRVILISVSRQFVSKEPFHGIWEVKTIFILNNYLPFSLLFFYEYILGFSRGYLSCDIVADWMQKQIGEPSCLLLSQELKRFAKTGNSATLLTKF